MELVLRKNEPEWLQEYRREAWRRWEELPFPTRTDEEWRRTDLSGLNFEQVPGPIGKPLPEFKATGEYAGVAAQDETRSVVTGEGVSTIVASGIQDIGKAFDRTEKKFSSLNDAFFGPGLAAVIKKNLERPVNLISLFRGGRFFPRSLVVVEPGVTATVLEERLGQGDGIVYGHTEVRVKQGGKLVFVRLQNLPRVPNFESIHVTLERDARLELATIDLGTSLTKLTLDLDMAEQGSEFVHNGLVNARDEQNFDLHVKVNHRAPRTSSDLLIKCAVRDKAKTAFTGLIKVEKCAVQTDAFQTNRNLILSKGARSDSIPKLEILADDVKCGHGSATGSIDADQLFYLQSRGIPPAESERLIVEGFFEDVLGRMTAPEWVMDTLRTLVIGDGRVR